MKILHIAHACVDSTIIYSKDMSRESHKTRQDYDPAQVGHNLEEFLDKTYTSIRSKEIVPRETYQWIFSVPPGTGMYLKCYLKDGGGFTSDYEFVDTPEPMTHSNEEPFIASGLSVVLDKSGKHTTLVGDAHTYNKTRTITMELEKLNDFIIEIEQRLRDGSVISYPLDL
jgi:hypothetical protein